MSIGGIGGPEGPKGVNNINGNNGVDKTTQTGNINSAFGQGFAGSNVDSSPISFLVNKFDFDIPKYPKGGFKDYIKPTDKEIQMMAESDRITANDSEMNDDLILV